MPHRYNWSAIAIAMEADKIPLIGSRTTSWHKRSRCEARVSGGQTRVQRPQDYKIPPDGQHQNQQPRPFRPSTSLFPGSHQHASRDQSTVSLDATDLHGRETPYPVRTFLVVNAAGLWGMGTTRMCWYRSPRTPRSLRCVHLLLHGRGHFLPIVLPADATVSWLKSQYIPWEWKKPRTMRCGCQHRRTSVLGRVRGVHTLFFTETEDTHLNVRVPYVTGHQSEGLLERHCLAIL